MQLRYFKILKELKKEQVIDNNLYDSIYPCGSRPARLYGLPKMHKCKSKDEIPPFRPIVSSIGCYNYKLARYLGDLLSPLVGIDYCSKDTFTFVEELKQVSMTNKFMVSFDIVSLFTNIPLEQTINIAIDYIIKSKALKISKSDLKRLFKFATSQTHFFF